MISPFWIFLFSYLLGSVPFGLLVVKIAGRGDIRHIGSGNIGATNVFRTGSKSLAFYTLVADMLKGGIPVFVSKKLGLSEFIQCSVGLIAVLGHIFPIWLKLKGGKGVATSFGVYLALSPLIGIISLATWGVFAKIGRISSLSALLTFLMIPLYAFFLREEAIIILGFITFIIMTLTHRSNIKRLLKGQESKL